MLVKIKLYPGCPLGGFNFYLIAFPFTPCPCVGFFSHQSLARPDLGILSTNIHGTHYCSVRTAHKWSYECLFDLFSNEKGVFIQYNIELHSSRAFVYLFGRPGLEHSCGSSPINAERWINFVTLRVLIGCIYLGPSHRDGRSQPQVQWAYGVQSEFSTP